MENALTRAELSLPQYRMLIFLSEGGADAASALAGKLGVSRPSVTALVDGLVSRGLAERCADPVDRRRVTHAVTDAGRAALDRADRIVEERLAELATQMADDDARDTAYSGLAQWLDAMNVERDERLASPE